MSKEKLQAKYAGRDHDSFVRMLDQLPSYQISYVQDGKRIFKTICNK